MTLFEKWSLDKTVKVSEFTELMFRAYEIASSGNLEKLQKAFPAEFLPAWQQIELTRINNDSNGNPRYVCHYGNLLNGKEDENLKYNERYSVALARAKNIGGRKFHNKQYGGGIVFQSYNTDQLKQQIASLAE